MFICIKVVLEQVGNSLNIDICGAVTVCTLNWGQRQHLIGSGYIPARAKACYCTRTPSRGP